MLYRILLIIGLVCGTPVQEPLYIKSIKGIPIKGKHPPIGPGSDNGLYNQEFFEGDIQLSHKESNFRNAITDKTLLWPYAAISYKIDDNVGCPDSPQCGILMKAIDNYHEKSCIRFKEWSGEENFVEIFYNERNSGACWSRVGRVGGAQKLSLGHRCWYLGIVIHELGHVVGFWHEMNRPDRDSYIYIYWANILQNFRSAFNKQSNRIVSILGEKFDFKSIMMYDEYAFSKDGKSPTLQAKSGEEIGPLWRKFSLSNADIRKIQKLYSCNGIKQKSGFPYNVICDFNQHTCGFHNGGSSVWNWRLLNKTDGYIYTSYETSGTTPGYLMSINFHPVNAGERKSPLGCLRFWYLLQSDGTSSLKVYQSYLNKVTQLKHINETTYELWSNNTESGKWIHVDIPLYIIRSFKLIFQTEFKDDNTYGTIALDDVELHYSECRQNSNGATLLPDVSENLVEASPKLVHPNDYDEIYYLLNENELQQ